MATRNGRAEWRGDLQGGSGRLALGEDGYEGDYTFRSRFEEGEGTNPEELLAAAHAACFSMALANMLAGDGHTPESVSTTARAHLRNVEGAPTIARIDLVTEGRVEGLEEQAFRDYAEQVKQSCIVSRALASVPEITLEARLAG